MVELFVTSSLGVLTICLFVCLGNALTLTAIFRYRQLRTKCNLLVAHLALVDLITGLVTWPVLQFLADDASGSQMNCVLAHAIVVSLKETAQFLLLAIAAVMYVKIAYPLRYGFWLSMRRLHALSLAPWVVGVAMGFACLAFARQGEGEGGQSLEGASCFVTVIPASYWASVINWPFIAISISILIMYVRIVHIARQHCRQSAVHYGGQAGGGGGGGGAGGLRSSKSLTSCSSLRRNTTAASSVSFAGLAAAPAPAPGGGGGVGGGGYSSGTDLQLMQLQQQVPLDGEGGIRLMKEDSANGVTDGASGSDPVQCWGLRLKLDRVGQTTEIVPVSLQAGISSDAVAPTRCFLLTTAIPEEEDESDQHPHHQQQQQQEVKAADNNNTAAAGSGSCMPQQQQSVVTFAACTGVDTRHPPAHPPTPLAPTPSASCHRAPSLTSQSIRRTRQELQVTLTMMLAFLAFVACWLPLEVAIYCANAGLVLDGKSLIIQVGLALSLANSGINVLIYSWRYATFRRALVGLLTCDRRRTVRAGHGDSSLGGSEMRKMSASGGGTRGILQSVVRRPSAHTA